MKKGFTLIELLSVIVILAIIALIATPIILGIIKDSKELAAKSSVENYLKAVELSISNKYVKDPTIDLNGTYQIKDKGKKIESIDIENSKEITIEYEGNGLTEGYIVLEKGEVIELKKCRIDDWSVNWKKGEILDPKPYKEEIKVTLVKGETFNAAIKNLANNSTTKDSWSKDTTVTTMEFYSNGLLPKEKEKYLEELGDSNKVDVSASGDNSIIAYYDNGKVYIISDNLISLNRESGMMFYAFGSVTNIEFYGIDTSEATSMGSMFNSCANLTGLDLSDFDTSNVTSMVTMFSNDKSLTNITFGEKFDTSGVTTMNSMFSNCHSLTSLDLSNFDTSSIKDTGMKTMFAYCYKLESIKLGKNFKTSKVTSMYQMFQDCNALTSLDVSNWDVSKVKDMSYMFYNCKLLTSLDVSKWNTNSVETMNCMFYGCNALQTLDVSKWNTSNVKDAGMNTMFKGCHSLTSLDVSNWDVSKVTSMSGTFIGCRSLTSLDVSNWDVSKVTSMHQMFNGIQLTELDLSGWNTSSVTTMQEMFGRTPNLISIKIGCGWKTAENTTEMFSSSKYTLDKLNALVEEIKPTCPVVSE